MNIMLKAEDTLIVPLSIIILYNSTSFTYIIKNKSTNYFFLRRLLFPRSGSSGILNKGEIKGDNGV